MTLGGCWRSSCVSEAAKSACGDACGTLVCCRRGHGDGGAARGIGTIPEEASGEVGRDSGGSGVMEKGGAKEGGHELYTLGGRERGKQARQR